MGSEPDYEPSSTPKLSFFALPSQPSEPAGMLTPPLRPPASVPFVWEEAPGRPRTCDEPKPTSARCLHLPPRLLTEMKNTNLPSPKTVLDGPYVARSISCASFRDVNLHRNKIIPEKGQLANFQKKDKERFVGLWGKRVGKKMAGGPPGVMDGGDGEEGPLVLSPSSSFSSFGDREENTRVKITRFRRNRSLLNIPSTSSHFWANLYGSFKQVMVGPWRARKMKN